MEHAVVERLFERYEEFFNKALAGDDLDMDQVAALYADEFIGAAPAGVMTGRNDTGFRTALARGFAQKREIGTRSMRIRGLRLSPIDDLHGVAHVAWAAVYARPARPDAVIDFEVHYLVRQVQGDARVFGWISGDEQPLLREHGIVGA
jgi:hypothetical protein